MVFPTSLSDSGSAVPLAICAARVLRAALVTLLFMAVSPVRALDNAEIAQSVLDSLDPAAQPCENFYQFACGNWIANQSLEPGEQSRDKSFSTAQDRVYDQLLAVFERVATAPNGPTETTLATLYQSCVAYFETDDGSAAPEKLVALNPYVSAIQSVTDPAGFLRVAGQLWSIGVAAPLGLDLIPDLIRGEDSAARQHLLILKPGDLGLPDADVYLVDSPINRSIRSAYLRSIEQTLALLGDQASDQHAAQIFKFERILAKHHPDYGNGKGLWFAPNPQSLSTLKPSLAWQGFFENLDDPVAKQSAFLFHRAFLREFGQALTRARPDTLQAYLLWSLMSGYASHLPAAYRGEGIDSIGLTARPRTPTQRCIRIIPDLIPEALGPAWVTANPAGTERDLLTSLFENVRGAFLNILGNLPWLDETSRAALRVKTEATLLAAHSPDTWPNFSRSLDASDYLGNVVTAQRANRAYFLSYDLANVDRAAWDPDASIVIVNASNRLLKNQVNVPLAILRAPLLHPDFPAAMNYGSMGAILGHELTHGVGPSGQVFDENGYFDARFLTPTTRRRFAKLTQCLTSQYSRQRVEGGPIRIRGKTTLEENVADLGGVRFAWSAFAAAGGSGDLAQTSIVSGFTEEQLFFVSYAQTFCQAAEPGLQSYLSSRRWQLYAPNEHRVNLPLANFPEFGRAFACPVGVRMNPRKKCEIW